MNREMEEAAREAERLYGDILYMEHPVSKKHHPAPRASRAAQFSPFAALSGYDAAVKETARLTDEKPELSEEQKLRINETIRHAMNRKPPAQVMITYFESDARKEGGSFESVTDTIRRVTDLYLETGSRQKIRLEDMIDMTEITDGNEEEGGDSDGI